MSNKTATFILIAFVIASCVGLYLQARTIRKYKERIETAATNFNRYMDSNRVLQERIDSRKPLRDSLEAQRKVYEDKIAEQAEALQKKKTEFKILYDKINSTTDLDDNLRMGDSLITEHQRLPLEGE